MCCQWCHLHSSEITSEYQHQFGLAGAILLAAATWGLKLRRWFALRSLHCRLSCVHDCACVGAAFVALMAGWFWSFEPLSCFSVFNWLLVGWYIAWKLLGFGVGWGVASLTFGMYGLREVLFMQLRMCFVLNVGKMLTLLHLQGWI